MLENKVSATFTLADLTEVLNHIKAIENKLPFLISMTIEQKALLSKLGDKSQAFVNKSYELVKQKSEFMPRNFNVEEMGKDIKMYADLMTINTALELLTKKIDDTQTEVGCEALDSALTVYDYAKKSTLSAELETLISGMGQRFAKKRASQPELNQTK